MAGDSNISSTSEGSKLESFSENLKDLFNDLDHKITFQMIKTLHDLIKSLKQTGPEQKAKESEQVIELKLKFEDLVRSQFKEALGSMADEIKNTQKECEEKISRILDELKSKLEIQDSMVLQSAKRLTYCEKELMDTKIKLSLVQNMIQEMFEEINQRLGEQEKKTEICAHLTKEFGKKTEIYDQFMKELNKKIEEQEKRFTLKLYEKDKEMEIMIFKIEATVKSIFEEIIQHVAQLTEESFQFKNIKTELKTNVERLIKNASSQFGIILKQKSTCAKSQEFSREVEKNEENWKTQKKIEENQDQAGNNCQNIKY